MTKQNIETEGGIRIGLGLGGLQSIPRGGSGRSTDTRKVRSIGTSQPAQKKPVDEVREPLVDLFDEGDLLLVIVELPGMGEDDIQVKVKDDLLKLSTKVSRGRRYTKEVYIPCPVDEGTVESTYKNGILEIRLHKVIEEQYAFRNIIGGKPTDEDN